MMLSSIQIDVLVIMLGPFKNNLHTCMCFCCVKIRIFRIQNNK